MSKSRIAVLIALLLSLSAAQTRILLCDFERRGVSDTSLVHLTTQLLQDALNATYKFTVMTPAHGSQIYGVVAAAESARAYGAAEAMIGNLMQIGSKSFLSYQLIDAASSTVKLADRVEIPPIEEFPPLADRIATSVEEQEPYSKTVEPEKVTAPEVEPKFKNPRKPYSSVLLTAGYQYELAPRPFTDAAGNHETLQPNLVNLNVAASFETQSLLTMLQLGLMRGRFDESDLNFDLFVNHVFGNGDWAPLAGAGIGITRYTWKDQTNSATMRNDGLNLALGGGVVGLRSYYFRLLGSAYATYTIPSQYGWKNTPGLRVNFGVTTPSLGPDATLKLPPACVGGIIGGFFLTGLIIALTS